jgi:hypothetical protein
MNVECFVIYLAGHNRPIPEVLFGDDKDVADEYRNTFVGMTTDPVSSHRLLESRARLRAELSQRLTGEQQFLKGLARAQPDWTLLECPQAAEVPALRRKLANEISDSLYEVAVEIVSRKCYTLPWGLEVEQCVFPL